MNRTLGRMLLLSAAAVVLLHGASRAEEPSPLGDIPTFQVKLAQRIDFELPKATALDDALDDLLAKQGISYEFNDAALSRVMLVPNDLKKTELEPIRKIHGVTRRSVLERLLRQVPATEDKQVLTYVLRPDHLEITTQEAKTIEARGTRVPDDDAAAVAMIPLAPLAYASFNDVPLADALKELAHTTESTILLDGRAPESKTKVTAELNGVPVDVAVQLLADMADLKMVRVANVYYVTSVKKAEALQKEEDRCRQDPSDNPPMPPARAGGSAVAAPPTAAPVAKQTPPQGKADDAAIQPLVRPLLALTTVGVAPAPPDTGLSPASRAAEMQNKLNQLTDYEMLTVPLPLHMALNELLDREGIPHTVNERAFTASGQKGDVVRKTEITDKIDKMIQVSRSLVLSKLLSTVPAKSADGAAVWIVRPGHVEITTRRAFLDEFCPDGDEAAPPPPANAVYRNVPLQSALADLADTGGNIVLDPRVEDKATVRVTASFAGVPLGAAIRVLADQADLKLVRLGNVYYVTTRQNALRLRKEEGESSLKPEKMKKADQ